MVFYKTKETLEYFSEPPQTCDNSLYIKCQKSELTTQNCKLRTVNYELFRMVVFHRRSLCRHQGVLPFLEVDHQDRGIRHSCS